MKGQGYLIFLIVFYTAVQCFAHASEIESEPPSIITSKEDSQCIKKSQSVENAINYHDCLINQLHQSNKNLEDQYKRKVDEIRNSTDYEKYDRVTADRKSLRPAIETAFIHEQQLWIAYRNSYCNNVVAGDITGDYAFVGNISCTINMNKRRIEEINLMYTPATDWGKE